MKLLNYGKWRTLNEQTAAPEKPVQPILISGISYKLPKIKSEQDINNFINWNAGGDVVAGLNKIIGDGRAFDYPVKEGDTNSPGRKVYRAMSNLLQLHAILGQTKPYTNIDSLVNWKPAEGTFNKETITKINEILASIKDVWTVDPQVKASIIKEGDKKHFLEAYNKILAEKVA